MASFSKYKTKKGTFWRFQLIYIDPTTKIKKRVGQGQFITKTQVKLAAEMFEKKLQQSAVRMEIIDKNPATAVIVPKAKQQKIKKRDTKKEFYTRDELKKFLDDLHEYGSFQAYTFFRLLAFTGMRKGEALALNWSDINFSQKKIIINKTQSNGYGKLVIQSTKTEASERTIFIDDKTIEILGEWHKLQKVQLLQLEFNSNSKNQLIFASTINKMHNPNKPRVWMTRITKEYDLKHISVHGFRHTYATLAIQGGMPPKQLQSQLGHRDIRTTLDIYTSVTKEQKQDTAERFTSFVNF